MDTLLSGGDHALDGRGLPATIDGDRELVQRALIRLQVRRGSFAADPALGSDLHKLRGARPEALGRLALAYAQEALSPMTGVAVEAADVTRTGRDTLLVAVRIAHRGQIYPLEVELT